MNPLRKFLVLALTSPLNSGHMNFVDQPDLWEQAAEGFLRIDQSTGEPAKFSVILLNRADY